MLRGVRGVGCFLRFGQEDFLRSFYALAKAVESLDLAAETAQGLLERLILSDGDEDQR